MFPNFIPESVEMFPHPMIATVYEEITPHQPGRVEFQASYWFAEVLDPQYSVILPAGSRVLIVGRRGITLLVLLEDETSLISSSTS